MATYTLISSQVLGSSAASVTFSSIPSTYKDLVLKTSIRTDYASTIDYLFMTINGDTSAKYSWTRLQGNGSAATSGRQAASAPTPASGTIYFGFLDGNTTTSNTFANGEIYIPNYTSTTSKQISTYSATENNATQAFIDAFANLYTGTSAISSLLLQPQSGNNFVSGSSFYLYGI
jgi:hypothetical protein